REDAIGKRCTGAAPWSGGRAPTRGRPGTAGPRTAPGCRDRRTSGTAYSDADMPSRRTIGVDMGGTKLLAGAVDAGLGVHHRAQRTVAGLDQAALLDTVVDAVLETR